MSKADRLLCDTKLADVRRQTIELARRALLGRFPGLSPDGEERTPSQVFEVSIPDLFEETVRTVMDKAVPCQFIVPEQVMRHFPHDLCWEHRASKPTLPDIFARRGPVLTMMGDVKYKRVLRESSSTFRPLSRDDFHQICTYAHAWPNAENLVMLYPDTNERAADEPATRNVASMTLADGRELKVFTFAPERWSNQPTGAEPLLDYLQTNCVV